jgi:hypothetical protein
MQRQGTVEYRIFNGVYRYLSDIVAIVEGLDRLAESGSPDFEPMILGTTPAFTAEDMSRLLQYDVSHIWGWQWPRACQVRALPGHYQGFTTIPSWQDEVVTVQNNLGMPDTKIDSFSFFREV